MVKALKPMTPVDELLVRLFHAPRILVVEDMSVPVESMLHRNWDCSVDTTSDPAQAVKLMSVRKYDLVFLDLVLLNGTSRKVVEAARKYCPDTPVVAIKVSEARMSELLGQGPLTVMGNLTVDAIAHLFRVFRIKARTVAIAEYCASLMKERVTAEA